MQSLNQMTLTVTSIIISITLIVGIILLTIALFKIKNHIEKNEKLIIEGNRPFLICTLQNNQLLIKNIGKTTAILDSTDQSENLYQFSPLTIAPKEVVSFYLINQLDNYLFLNYHDEHSNYSESKTINSI